ncbi:MAG: methyltransferase domain-containing protein [Geminicoccaceae bacterium]
MLTDDTRFAGSIPQVYDRYMGPLVFAPYAADLAERVAALQPTRVLETAAGTGVLTRALVAAIPENTEIIATDLNPAMLDHAAGSVQRGRLTFQQADAQTLPFDDAPFDVVACQFGAMFFPDRRAAYREARRVLRPGGRFALNVWDRIETNDLASIVTEVLATLMPDDPPRFLARTPHGYHDREALLADLEAAGFSVKQVETLTLSSPADSPRQPAIAYCQGTPLRNEIEARIPGRLAEATETVARALADRYGDGPFEAPMRAHVVVAERT